MFHRQESFACNRRDDADVESSYPFLFIYLKACEMRFGTRTAAQMQNRRHQVFTLWVVIIAANFGFVALQF